MTADDNASMLDFHCRLINQQKWMNVRMTRRKKKLTPAQKAAKEQRAKEYMTIFINGKQKRVKRPETIDGLDVYEFIRRNADPIWLHQEGMWELIDPPPDN